MSFRRHSFRDRPGHHDVDLLSEILGELRLTGALHGRFVVGAGSGVAYPAGAVAGFHVVTEGELLLVTDGGQRRALAAGDFVVVPHGTGHRLQAGPAARAEPVEAVAARRVDGVAQVGHGAPAARYVCGAFALAFAGEHPLLSALPEVLHVRAADGEALPWLRSHLDAVCCESRSGRPGSAAVITRLSEVLFVQAIRHALAELPPGASGWLAALREPQLARAVALIHRQPERPWTVATLAAEAGMSRSHFAERFAAVLGRPPLAYLAEWRLHVARVLLRRGTLRVHEVARRVGYGSEAAFATAFRRAVGESPGTYRRAGHVVAPAA
jgi:AraC-like DNA-binding protein